MANLGIRNAFDLSDPNLGVATVMSALPLMIPLVIFDAQIAYHGRGAVTMSVIAVERRARARADSNVLHAVRVAQRRRYLTGFGSVILGIVLVIWSVLPIYNMIMVSVYLHSDVFTTHLFPPHPSVDMLMYDDLRTAADPKAALTEFLQSTYEAAADAYRTAEHWNARTNTRRDRCLGCPSCKVRQAWSPPPGAVDHAPS